MQKEQQELANLIKGKKVAFIARASAIRRSSRSSWSWVRTSPSATRKRAWKISATTLPPSRSWASI